jgi:imidazolonepropionase-like amidohydrolase
MRISRTGLLALAASAAFALPAQTVAITGGTVYPVSGPPIKNGTVVITKGKITAVGANVAIPAGATKIDATGKWVTPGLVNAVTSIGLVDVGFGADANESGAQGADHVSASFQPWLGYNTDNVLIPNNREYGITTVGIWPRRNMVAGQGAMLDLAMGSLSEVLLKAPAGMSASFEGNGNAGVGAQGELVGKMNALIEDTKYYMAHKEAYNGAKVRAFAFRREDMEAMIPVVTGRIPLVLNVDRANDIEEALKFGKSNNLKIMLAGASEGWMVAAKIAAAKVPVLVGAMNNIPGDFNSLNTRQENAAILRKAGVTVILVGNAGGGDEDGFNVRNIRYEAGNAVGYGMTWDDALAAITWNPAAAFGVSDRVGALKVGMEGNVVVWNGDPFEFATRAEHVFVRGVENTAPSRQDLLTQRYKTLPATYDKNPK